MIRKAWFSLLLACAVVTPAAAGPLTASVLDSDDLAWFYNRPGVTVEEIGADQNACRGFAAMMLGAGAPSPGPYGLAGDVIGAIASAGLSVAYVDDCMMSKGYRRFDIADTRLRDFQTRFQALPAEQQLAYFSAETPPEGVLARRWSNTYWLPREGDAAIQGARNFLPRAMTRDEFNRVSQPGWVRPAEANATPAAGEVLLVFTLRSSGGNARFGLDRRTPDGEQAFTGRPNRANWPGIEPRIEDAQGPQAFVFAVPAGIYSLLYASTTRYNATTFCYGTIAIEAAAGQVIDLGDITIERGGEVVDPLAPAPTIRMRIDQPPVTAERTALFGARAANAQAAAYRNAFPRKCQLFTRGYGFELPGAAPWVAPAN